MVLLRQKHANVFARFSWWKEARRPGGSAGAPKISPDATGLFDAKGPKTVNWLYSLAFARTQNVWRQTKFSDRAMKLPAPGDIGECENAGLRPPAPFKNSGLTARRYDASIDLA